MADTFTGADVLLALIFLLSSLMGLVRGFIREAVSLGFWIVGLWAAWAFGPRIEPYLGGYLAAPAVRPWVGRLVVLVAVMFVSVGVGMLVGYIMRGAGLGLIDRAIGLMFGMTRGFVLIGLVVICAELLQMNHEAWWNHSKLIPYGEAMGDWLRAMVGERGEPWAKLERITGVKIR